MDDDIAKEIVSHLAGVKRQLTQVKWVLVAMAAAAVLSVGLQLAWHHPRPAVS